MVVDSFKPFLASVFAKRAAGGAPVVGVAAGVVVSSAVVYLMCAATASSEQEAKGEGEGEGEGGDVEEEDKAAAALSASNQTLGYWCAACNVALDAYGSVLTMKFGTQFTTFEINFMRFGFATVVMALPARLRAVFPGSGDSGGDKDSGSGEYGRVAVDSEECGG